MNLRGLRQLHSFKQFVVPTFSRDFSTASCSSKQLNFELTVDQRALQEAARTFVKKEIIPKAAEYDRSMEFPWDWYRKAHELGLMNIQVPTKYGGLGLDLTSEVILTENFGYGCQGFEITFVGHNLALFPVLLSGTEEIKKKYLSRLVEEPLLAAYCVTEAGCGSDVAAMQTRAEKKGADYVINGSKMWITNAGVANWYFVIARTEPDPKAPAGKAFTAFVVDADSPGITKGRKEVHMGVRCADNRAITFEDVVVPAANVVGAPGTGFRAAMMAFDKTRPLVAASAVGLIGRCLDEATKYSLERKAFGVPIVAHQAVSFMLADMATNLELARLMTYRSAREVELGRPLGSFYASLAKKFASESAVKASIDAVQIFGGAGYNTEYPVEKLMRDAKITTIGEGTTEIQKLVIARRFIEKFKEADTYFLNI